MKYTLLVLFILSALICMGQDDDNIGLLDGKKRKQAKKETKQAVLSQEIKNDYIHDKVVAGIPLLNNRIYYSEVDSCQGTKDELYKRAKDLLSEWFPNFYNVVKLDDKDLGKVRVRGIFETPVPKSGIIFYHTRFYSTVTIEVKDGRYKYEFSDFSDVTNGFPLEGSLSTDKRAKRFSERFSPYMDGVANSLKARMNSQSNW